MGDTLDLRPQTATVVSSIPTNPAPGATYAVSAYPGSRLYTMPDGKLMGDLGSAFANFAAIQAVPTANLALGTTAGDVSGRAWKFGGAGIGWLPKIIAGTVDGDIDLFGNSIIEMNGGRYVSGYTDNYSSKGFAVQAAANVLSCRIRENWGIGGQTSGQLLARISQVVRSRSNIVIVLEGSNDNDGVRTAASVYPNYIAIANAIIASGKICVMCGSIPRTTANAAQITFAAELNAMLSAYSAPGYIYCDVATPLNDGTGLAISGTLADGIHPNTYGAWLMSQPLTVILSALCSPRSQLVDAQAKGRNLLNNALFASTGTSAPASWNMQTAPSSWLAIARTDGIFGAGNGLMAQATVANDGIMVITQNVAVSDLPVGYPVRAYLRAKIKNRQTNPAAGTKSISLFFQYYNGSSFSGRTDAMYWDGSYANNNIDGDILLRTTTSKVPSGTTLTQLAIMMGSGGQIELQHAFLGMDPE